MHSLSRLITVLWFTADIGTQTKISRSRKRRWEFSWIVFCTLRDVFANNCVNQDNFTLNIGVRLASSTTNSRSGRSLKCVSAGIEMRVSLRHDHLSWSIAWSMRTHKNKINVSPNIFLLLLVARRSVICGLCQKHPCGNLKNVCDKNVCDIYHQLTSCFQTWML